MSDIPRDPIGAADSYHANITINAPIDTVFAAVSPVAGLSGCWTTTTRNDPVLATGRKHAGQRRCDQARSRCRMSAG
jgi:hypothetical protein